MKTLTWVERCDLAHCFAPHLILFPEQQALGRPGKMDGPIGDYHPRGIALLLERSRIASGFYWPRQPATLETLARSKKADDQLLILGRLIPDPDRAWKSYFQILNSTNPQGQAGRDRFPLTTYARVLTRAEADAAPKIAANLGKDYPLLGDEVGRPLFRSNSPVSEDDVSIQYWFCYYYDDWANQHEGDWEGIAVFLRRIDNGYEPVGVSYYAHETGQRRHWADVERSVLGGTHPLIFVAAGSHASYFDHVPNGYLATIPGRSVATWHFRFQLSISSTRTDYVPQRGRDRTLQPRVEVLPDPIGPINPNDSSWENRRWLSFPGTWGIRTDSRFGLSGPYGPSHKGLKWHHPFAWMERYCRPDFLAY